MLKNMIIILTNLLFHTSLSAQNPIIDRQKILFDQIVINYQNMIRNMDLKIAEGATVEQVIIEISDVQESIDLTDYDNCLPYRMPVTGYTKISSGYGYRKDPFTKKRAFHNGIDIPMPVSTQIYATAKGTVNRTGSDKLLGKFIEIEHENGYKTLYAHLNKILVREGQQVTEEELIGLSGNSGRSTGPHLHYQISHNGSTINPLNLIYQLNSY